MKAIFWGSAASAAAGAPAAKRIQVKIAKIPKTDNTLIFLILSSFLGNKLFHDYHILFLSASITLCSAG
jgi:hypothetical protein